MVTSASAGAAQQLRFERVLQIGEDMGRAEYSFGFVADVATGRDGRVYVLDTQNAEVRVFDRTGRHLHSFGRRGEGPGEFRAASRVFVDGDRVVVTDVGLQRSVSFTTAGQHIATSRIEAPVPVDIAIPLRGSRWLGARSQITSNGVGELIAAPRGVFAGVAAEFRRRNEWQLVLFKSGEPGVDTLVSYDHGRIQHVQPGRFGSVPGYVSRGAVWAVSGDSMIAIVDAFQGTLQILRVNEDGRIATVRRSHTAMKPIPLNDASWRRIAEANEFKVPPAARLTGPPFAAQLRGVLFADDGSLWIRRTDWRDGLPVPGRILVIPPPGGGAQYHVDPPTGLSIIRVGADELFGVRRTEFGSPLVEIWRFVR